MARTGSEYRRWLLLTGVRIAYLGVIALVTGSNGGGRHRRIVGLGPPAFNPPQQAVLYGYRSGVVMVAARWGGSSSRSGWPWRCSSADLARGPGGGPGRWLSVAVA